MKARRVFGFISDKGVFRAILTGLILIAAPARAQTVDRSAADAELVKRIKEAVLNDLRESGALDRAADAGIARFIARQRADAEHREQREASARAGALRPVSPTRDHIRGNPDAPVALIEYSDFECPFCKRFHATAIKLIDENQGRVKWVYRHFPIDELHPAKARREAAASECAAELGGNDAFWKFADRFYAQTPSNNRTDIAVVLPRIAREIGLDKARFATCLESGRHDRRVEEDRQNALDSGANGTPYSVVVSKNGKTYALSGAQPYAVVKQLVDLAGQDK